MDAKIKGSFWTDDGIGTLTESQKLTAVWVMSNPQVSIIGVTKISARAFKFETGQPIEALTSLCEALPSAFIYRDGLVVARNFVRHQFGGGDSFRRSNIFKAVETAFGHISLPWLRTVIEESCPDLKLGSLKVITSPPKSLEGQRAEQRKSRAVGGEGGPGETHFSEVASAKDAKVIAWAETWPGEVASGTPKIPKKWLHGWLAKINGRAMGWPQNWEYAVISDWRVASKFFTEGGLQNSGNKKNAAGFPDARTPAQARYALDKEMAEIKARLDDCDDRDKEPDRFDVVREKEIRLQLEGLAGS